MTYDRAAIMEAAWAIVRRADVARFGLRLILRNALRTAWREAKQAAFFAARAVRAQRPALPADLIRTEILALECKSRLFGSDWARLDALRAELQAAA